MLINALYIGLGYQTTFPFTTTCNRLWWTRHIVFWNSDVFI